MMRRFFFMFYTPCEKLLQNCYTKVAFATIWDLMAHEVGDQAFSSPGRFCPASPQQLLPPPPKHPRTTTAESLPPTYRPSPWRLQGLTSCHGLWFSWISSSSSASAPPALKSRPVLPRQAHRLNTRGRRRAHCSCHRLSWTPFQSG